MTALTISSDIPSNINTLERLFVWAGLALRRLNPSTAVLESANLSQPVMETALIRANDGTVRIVVRGSIEIDPVYAESALKFWVHAKELSNTELPAAFKSAT